MDVAFIFDLNLHLLGYLVSKRWALGVKWSQILIGQLRTANQVGRMDSGFQCSRSFLHQHPIERLRRSKGQFLNSLFLLRNLLLFVLVRLPALLINQSQLVSQWCQTLVCVVLAQQQTVLRTAGHHPVRVRAALGDQIVDQRSDIAGSAVQNNRLLTLHPTCSVDACNQSLCRSLLITGGSVELSCSV